MGKANGNGSALVGCLWAVLSLGLFGHAFQIYPEGPADPKVYEFVGSLAGGAASAVIALCLFSVWVGGKLD